MSNMPDFQLTMGIPDEERGTKTTQITGLWEGTAPWGDVQWSGKTRKEIVIPAGTYINMTKVVPKEQRQDTGDAPF